MIEFIERLSVDLDRDALLRFYKLFVRSHLDYRDIMYDKLHNTSLLKTKLKIFNIWLALK